MSWLVVLIQFIRDHHTMVRIFVLGMSLAVALFGVVDGDVLATTTPATTGPNR
jgi:hypothetical protein